MKIIAINKVLNEAEFIADYCHNHRFCDLILIADGGSTDETVKIAQTFSNVRVRSFDKRVELPDGSFMNPEPAHTNFLLDWADEEKVDWVLFVGCDTWPNLLLQRDARLRLKEVKTDAVLCNTLYLWGENEYFPKINQAGPGGWALRGGLGLRCDESQPTFFDTPMVKPFDNLYAALPGVYSLIHYYGSPERTPKKLARYAAWGHPQKHPLESIYAPPEPLPAWATETIPERLGR